MIELISKNEIQVSESLYKAWDQVFKLQDAKFYELPFRDELWSLTLKRSLEIQKAYNTTCVVGIGGSSLGGRALYKAFEGIAPHKVLFIESPDETGMARFHREMGSLSKVHFVFISKSGKTLETLALLDYWSQVLGEAKLDISKQSTVVCGASKSPLREWAESHHVAILPVPEDVGGRFSVLTPVGLLPAALMGVPLERLRAGAEWAVAQKDLVLQIASVSEGSFRDNRWISQMWIYSDAFQVLGLWWQQLWSESLGKKVLRSSGLAPRASTPMVCVGPQDQHSLLQQLQEGERDKWVILLRDEAAEKPGQAFTAASLKGLDSSFAAMHLGTILKAEADGFLGALDEARVPNVVLKANSTLPEDWGAFFMVWELVIGVMGEHCGINAFDQPGVELGKRLALQALRTVGTERTVRTEQS
jgi:glucose-6-phosphate isomerase